ncbi:RagB/SusD family nutrient uptake outer membrane protein [Echinicola rosea]|uniref:RagB/SusD family nutrient uptake outer membrane protein n=1 Tax=Echinicola rosea TaxID=1807691 RepID=A0ABQ1UPP3_9BACT|nr:RagB/SusD family nutrient uptake outer membrane protein [Echinicola rosea]GGF24153.1 hypothetical protein GCM10011339_10300 [Echinicola rosea]
MNSIQNHIIMAMIISIVHLLASCNGFLDEKPNKSIVIPDNFEAIRAILDASESMGRSGAIPVMAADEFTTDAAGLARWQAQWQRNVYLWDPAPFSVSDAPGDWATMYRQIFNANVVLDELEKLKGQDEELYNRYRGHALFIRAWSYFSLSQVFLPANLDGAGNGPVIPLKLTPELEAPYEKVGVSEIYLQVMDDLLEAERLLPMKRQYPIRPGKTACWALMARINLAFEQYGLAEDYSAKVLAQSPTLLDFKALDDGIFPFEQFNEEVIFHAQLIGYGFTGYPSTKVMDELYESYTENDLRKTIYFTTRSGNVNLMGTLTGNHETFCGLATGEVYLIHAECLARKGDTAGAMGLLNELLSYRYDQSFEPLSATGQTDALEKIILERRKELAYRGTRWSDLRRLNKDPRFAKTIVKILDGMTYTLPPGSEKYVLPVPPREDNFE